MVLATNRLPANCQSPNEEQPFRLKRPGYQVPNQFTDGANKPLQGNVSEVGTENGNLTGVSTREIINDFQSKPSYPPVLRAQAALNRPIETPPVLLPANATIAGPEVYRGWLEKAHPQFCLQTTSMPENHLVVVYDKYDNTERTLDSLGLRFTSVDKRQLDSYDLRDAQVVVIDCGPNNISPQGMTQLRDFVARGGYLFTTDWMLDRLDQLIFPGYIAWNGAINRQRMYDAAIVGESPALFKSVVTNAYWKMDVHCHLIRVLNKQAVRVLATSRLLAQDDPDGQGILAVVFPFGRGYVMHMTAHFDRSQSIFGYGLPDPAPVIGISLRQAIAINFVVAGLSGSRLSQ